jgi:hypothetical protein
MRTWGMAALSQAPAALEVGGAPRRRTRSGRWATAKPGSRSSAS